MGRPALLRPLRRELGRLSLTVLAGIFAGLAFDSLALGLLLALAAYLALGLRYLAYLYVWAEHPKRVDLPEPGGLWGEVYERLIERNRRSRKRKKQLAEIVAQFRASTEALPDGAVALGEHGEIAWFNASAQAMLGLRIGQDTGLRIPNLIRHPAFSDYFERRDFAHEVEVPSPVNDDITLALKLIPYGSRQMLLIVRDVSERKRLEAARRDFVANASHELRTPLTVLRGYLEMLEPEARREAALAAWRAPLAEMRAQAGRMHSLIADLLKLARLESDVSSHRHELLDVPRMLARAAEEARVLSKGQHRIETEVEPDLFLVGRESEIQSVFANLVHNAVQYTPPGGLIRLRWHGDGGAARFSVQDSGIGIAPSDIPRLTERFYRVDVARSRASGGTGLGLSIVKHALEQHEAALGVESILGVGSAFTCRFPAHRVQRKARAAANE
ncbi:MAG: phosphate regulon sensor histidine kinase PhoR [Gammaproteobacteria bacterium]|nr:phosphate regulon sensor histidine kinase PhoR [Gammaproteobacteria bacterium]